MGHEFDRDWIEIRGSRSLWFPGVFGVRCRRTGRAYFVGTLDIGKRRWDSLDRLRRGTHPCRQLQADWAERPEDFAFFLVARLPPVPWLIRVTKQVWIDAARGAGVGTYNVKNSIPRRSHRPAPRVT